MKLLKTTLLMLILLIGARSTFAEGTWISFTNANYIRNNTTHGDNLWCVNDSGVVRWNVFNYTFEKFTSECWLASNDVYAIAVDHKEDISLGKEGEVSLLVYEADNDQSKNGEFSDDRPKVAIITTIYTAGSHGDVIGTRLIKGYGYYGENIIPRVNVVSMYVDQVSSGDRSRNMADEYSFTIFPTIRETLLMGKDKLAIDGVVIIGEHGDYPANDKGQKLYPRYEFYKEVMEVFKETGREVPVFTDKHLSYDWEKAKWMYDQSIELGFPLMAGSSLPLTWRHPPLEIELGTTIEKAVVTLSSGGTESYGIHALEALQCMVERRAGGETGIKAVQYLEGSSAWAWTDNKPWAKELFEEAISCCQVNKSWFKRSFKPHLFVLEFQSGLEAAIYMNNSNIISGLSFGFATKIIGDEEIVSTEFWLQDHPYAHFSGLVYHIEELIINNEPSYTIERTLLTTGALAAIMDSRYNTGGFGDTGLRIETPHLNIVYTAKEESVYNQGKVPPYDDEPFVKTETPIEFSLKRNYSNPFNSSTDIEYSFPKGGHVTLTVYNISGKAVKVLKNGYHQAGKHSVIWNATDMPSGLYFCTLKVGGISETRKMVLVK